MLKESTVFVVGAGASSEFNLPIGTDLAIEISAKLDVRFDDWGTKLTSGDGALFENVRRASPQHANEYQQAAWVIRDGIVLANSIDDFLAVHQTDEKVVRYGKSAIVKCILEAEMKSRLFFDRNKSTSTGRETIDFRGTSDTWLVKLMRLLGKGLPAENYKNIFDRSSFIVFNYDRCIEHFFVNALQPMFRISEQAAADVVATARIVHPYGVAGALPLAGHAAQGPRFGSTNANYFLLSSEIKTYSESVDNTEARELIKECKRVVFLGFAFHGQNLKLLADINDLETKEVLGTGWGMSDSDLNILRSELLELFKSSAKSEMASQKIHLHNDLKAAEIFDYYSRSL